MIGFKGSQRGLQAFAMLAVPVLCLLVYQHNFIFSPNTDVERIATSIKDSTNGIIKRVAVPFGHDQIHNFSTPAHIVEGRNAARIQKRALSYYEAICKGEKHFLNIARAFFSRFTIKQTYSVQEIEEAGWTIDGDFMLQILDAMKPALRQFNIKDDADSNQIRYATQDKSYTGAGGNQEVSTQGQYYQLYNPSGKAIICPDNAAPGYYLNGMRENSAGGAAGSLQYIFRDNIVTEDTRNIIDEAIKPKKIVELAWPGITFSQDELTGQALMGTPHGNGIAWMIIEHIDVIGRRDIDITVYSGPGSGDKPYYYYMLFNLKPFGT